MTAGSSPRRVRKAVESGRQNQFGQAMGSKGAQTRRRLLDATAELLMTSRVRDIGVAQIVQAAQTSAATFYVYFNDVSDAILAVTGDISQSTPTLLALFDEPWTEDVALDRALEFVTAYLEHCRTHAPLLRVRNLLSDEGDARFMRIRLAAQRPLLQAMLPRVVRRQTTGVIPADVNPQTVSGALLTLIDQIAVLRLPLPDAEVTRLRLIRVASYIAALILSEAQADRIHLTDDTGALLARAGEIGGPAMAGASAADTPAPAAAAKTRGAVAGRAPGARGARTRDRLVGAAGELLRSRSLLHVTPADVAKAAGLAPSTFYLYFKDPLELLLELLTHGPQPPSVLASILAEPDFGSAPAKTEEFVQEYLAWWRENYSLLRIRQLAADEGDVRFARVSLKTLWPIVRALAEVMARGQAAGQLSPTLHPASAAVASMMMIERLAAVPDYKAVKADAGHTEADKARASACLLTLLTGGVKARQPADGSVAPPMKRRRPAAAGERF